MENEFTPFSIISGDAAKRVSKEKYSGEDLLVGGKADAMRHLVWQATMAKKFGPTFSNLVGQWHETGLIPAWMGGAGGYFPTFTERAAKQSPIEKEQDLVNNRLGREIAEKAETQEDIYRLAEQYINEGKAKLVDPRDIPDPYY